MLNACLSNPLSIIKTYIVFLKVLELFNLKYDFKLKLLYSWLRFFLIENHLDLFIDLLRNLKKSKKLDDEVQLYLNIEKFMNRELSFEDLAGYIQNFEDPNSISNIQATQLLDKMKCLQANE